MILKPSDQRAFAVEWKSIDRWSVKSLRPVPWHWPAANIKNISSALERRIEPVNKKTFEVRPEHLISLRFTGEIEPRELHGKTALKGNLFAAYAGDIVYSKIDVRNGAIGIVPDTVPVAAVTSEFPVYRVRKSIALPEYIQLLFRTRHFRSIINGRVSGASGRKRVQPDDLESIAVPIPPIQVQEAIVARWRQAQSKIGSINKETGKLKTAIDERFLADLGLRPPRQIAKPKAFAVQWKDLHRWGTEFNYLHQRGVDLTGGTYPVVALGEIIELVQYGTSTKANTTADGVAILRMNNIVDGQLQLANIKHVSLGRLEAERLMLYDGDILINRTNSKELVGKCAVYHEKGEFVFASYLIRLRANPSRVNADFLAYVINSPIGRQQINALSRQIIGQANINTKELRSLRIPLPPLNVQERIMARVAAGLSRIARERETARVQAEAVNADIEALILGTRTIENR